MKGKFFKMTLTEFFDRFLGITATLLKKDDTTKPPTHAKVFKSVIDVLKAKNKEDRKENLIQKAFIEAVNETKNSVRRAEDRRTLCPGYTLIGTQDNPDQKDSTKQRVSACIFSKEDDVDYKAQHWGIQRAHIEFKPSQYFDPFDDDAKNPKDFDALDTNDRKKTRGQIISYAAKVFMHQHRCFFFSVLILGPYARIIRWDRAGAVVTERFVYTTQPALREFFRRFALLSEQQQGIDITATRVEKDSAEYELMEKLKNEVKTTVTEQGSQQSNDSSGPAERTDKSSDEEPESNHEYARKLFAKSLDDDFPRWKLKVFAKPMPVKTNDSDRKADPLASTSGSTTVKPRFFLVGRPRFCADGMAGRGTRGYVAIEWQGEGPGESFVYLKDAWRIDQDDIPQEGDILSHLRAKDVINIPTLVCHGDVDEQETMTEKCWADAHPNHAENPLRSHKHYRMVVEEVGRPLDDVENAHHLVCVLYDCFCAHEQAFCVANVLHRDVSRGNMLMFMKKGILHGLLIDWELSKSLGEGAISGARQAHRTGTWQFMSARLLMSPAQGSILQDDFESFFHVLLYIAVRYLKHNCSDVGTFMTNFFDAGAQAKDNTWIVGPAKWTAMKTGELEFLMPGKATSLKFDSTGTDPHPLDTILEHCLTLFKAHYRVINEDATRTVMEPANKAPSEKQHGDRPVARTTNAQSRAMALDDEPDATLDLSVLSGEFSLAASRANAAKLTTHDHLRNYLLLRAKDYAQWPEHDRAERDLLLADHRPRLNDESDGTDLGSKRGRSNEVAETLALPKSKRTKSSKPKPKPKPKTILGRVFSRPTRSIRQINYAEPPTPPTSEDE